MTRRWPLALFLVANLALNVALARAVHRRADRPPPGDDSETPALPAQAAVPAAGAVAHRASPAGRSPVPRLAAAGEQAHCREAVRRNLDLLRAKIDARPDARGLATLFSLSPPDQARTRTLDERLRAVLEGASGHEGSSLECHGLACRLEAGFSDEAAFTRAQLELQRSLAREFPGLQLAIGPRSNPGGEGTGLRIVELYFRDPSWPGEVLP
jgi:hypothetical protein